MLHGLPEAVARAGAVEDVFVDVFIELLVSAGDELRPHGAAVEGDLVLALGSGGAAYTCRAVRTVNTPNDCQNEKVGFLSLYVKRFAKKPLG